MKNEQDATILDLCLNLLIVAAEIISGVIFNSYTLICNGYYTLVNLIEEFIAHISSKVRGRKANLRTPFGVGKLEYTSHMIIGIIFILMAIYIFIKTFSLTFKETNIYAIILLIPILIYRYLSSNNIYSVGRSCNSSMLVLASHIDFYDMIVTIYMLPFIILSIWFPVFDLAGSLVMSILLLSKGINIIIYNIVMLKGQNDTSKKITNKVKKIVNSIDGIKYSNISLVNIKTYYMVTIEIEVDNNMSISEVFFKEAKIEKLINKEKLHIKSINFDVG